jgi:hypothetical protein
VSPTGPAAPAHTRAYGRRLTSLCALREIELEQPTVHLVLYETSVQIPSGWRELPCSCILLSEGYQADAELAESLGWPVAALAGEHLDIVNNPVQIAEQIFKLHQNNLNSKRRTSAFRTL